MVIANENAQQLATIPGIGKKTAERIILDLRDRLLREHPDLSQINANSPKDDLVAQQALSALVNLGYPQTTVMETLRGLKRGQTLGVMIKMALKELSRS